MSMAPLRNPSNSGVEDIREYSDRAACPGRAVFPGKPDSRIVSPVTLLSGCWAERSSSFLSFPKLRFLYILCLSHLFTPNPCSNNISITFLIEHTNDISDYHHHKNFKNLTLGLPSSQFNV